MTIPRAEPDALDQAAVLALIDPAAEWKYRLALCREAYGRGHRAGFHEGYEQAVRDLERNWQIVAKKVKKAASGPTYAELQARRSA
jgi:flagellar biosynthesis/type III secretory pathway protein FliH